MNQEPQTPTPEGNPPPADDRTAEYLRQRAEVDAGKRASVDMMRFLDQPEGTPPPEEGDGVGEDRADGGTPSDPPAAQDDAPPEDGADGDGSEEQPGSEAEGPKEPPAWLKRQNRRILRRANRDIAKLNEKIAALEARLNSGSGAQDSGTGDPESSDDTPLDDPYPRMEDYGDDKAAFDADVDRWNAGESLLGPKGNRKQKTEASKSEGAPPPPESRTEERLLEFAEILDEKSGDDEDLDRDLRALLQAGEASLTDTMVEHMVDGMDEDAMVRAVSAMIKTPRQSRKIARMAPGRQKAELDKLGRDPKSDPGNPSRRSSSRTNTRLPTGTPRNPRKELSGDMDFQDYAALRRRQTDSGFGGIDAL